MAQREMNDPMIVNYARKAYHGFIEKGDQNDSAIRKATYVALGKCWRRKPVDMTNYATRIRYGEQYEALLAAIQEPKA